MKNKELFNLLKKDHLTLGAVESMTGGLFSKTITDINGSSKVFKGSIIAYSLEAKTNILKINQEFLQKYGVVSREVAIRLAKQGQKILGVDLCISVTGNAGPTVESDQKEVGEVYYAIYYLNQITSYKLKLEGSRESIRKQTTQKMIESLIDILS